ncbi:hypothetical protein SB00610_04053 [Klebsiella quasipneumoniae subsp. similipneumoniae]|nr:hypothetical protein SB00610_04053 [Klebsiella quasipneumoniae subsp. similipneumoniae]
MERVKRQRQAEDALVEHGVHPRRRRREILTRPPQRRVQRIEIAPQRGGDRREGRRLRRLAQGGRLVGEGDQQLLQQGGTRKVRRPRVGHAAGMGSGEGQQRLRAGGWLRRLPAACDKRQLGAAPRRLRALGGDRKIFLNRFLQIDIAPVGQRFGPAGEQQVGLF